jgi:thiol-disulfide isomerase/thioredoxin
MKRSVVVVLAICIAIFTGWLGFRLSGAGSTASNPPTVAEAPGPGSDKALLSMLEATFPDAQGRLQAMKQWSGKVLVVNFWATWCPPCREEMPGFSRLQTRYSGNGVQFVGIGVDDADKIQQYQKESPVSYPLLVAGPETMSWTAELGNPTEGLPFTVFVDRQGRIHSTRIGRMGEDEVEHRLQELL